MASFLVIEDSITIRKLVELAFRGSPVQLEFASTGADGLAQIRSGTPHVVLMDYVLPDMKGVDVCARIAASDMQKPFVIVMSARMNEVRQQFAAFPFVTHFVSKPFKAAAIVDLVVAALGRDAVGGAQVAPATPSLPQHLAPAMLSLPQHLAPITSSLPPAERETAAFALFAQLRPKLAQIPSWIAEMGDTPPAKFFAKRILTPEVVAKLLDSLLPILRDRLRRTSPFAETLSSDSLLEGRIGGLSPYDILALVQRLERTVELVIGDHGEIVTFVRDGKLVLATTRDPAEWSRDLTLDLSSVPAEAMRRAEEEQAASGKPLLVTLAELGNLPHCNLSGLLNEQGKRVLKRVLGRLGAGTPFAVKARATLPLYVDAYGRGISFRQVVLERLRDEPQSMRELPAAMGETVFERRAGFSKRLLQFELAPSERRVLALIDGNATARSIAQRTGLSVDETCAALRRLEATDLLGRREPVLARSEAPPSSVHRQVMILEPDLEGFQKPLEHLLGARPDSFQLVAVDGEQDVFAAIRRTRPSLVILNATSQGREACARTARAVRGSDELRDILLVAVLELPSSEDAPPLSEAGFDAVLAKPVSYADIERLLIA